MRRWLLLVILLFELECKIINSFVSREHKQHAHKISHQRRSFHLLNMTVLNLGPVGMLAFRECKPNDEALGTNKFSPNILC